MMNRSTARLVLLLAVMTTGASPARAQLRLDVAPRLGFDLVGDVEEFFLGLDARVGLDALPVILNPAFDYYFTESPLNVSQFSINALYPLRYPGLRPYVGGGIGITRLSIDRDGRGFGGFDKSDTDVGLNLIGGVVFRTGNLRPFAQAQITFGDVDLFTVAGGLLFRLGKH
ncbi:outer membrane protein [Rhodocaloribacter sp.]